MKVAILRAIGEGGLQDPRTGVYVSSKRDTIAPFGPWAEGLVNHGQLKIVEVLENSDWTEYVNHLARANGDEDAALAAYRKVVPSADNGVERMRSVESAADLERQEDQEAERTATAKRGRGTRSGEAAVDTTAAE